MSGIYHMLAPFYDALNQEVDYQGMLSYFEKQFDTYMPKRPLRILDLACGTGSMALTMAKAGYYVTGLDLSCEMLSVAQQRIDRSYLHKKIMLTMQDMTCFDVGAGYDAVVCTLDGINHLPSPVAVEKCFCAVREALNEGGLFLFDVNSLYKFTHIFADEAYTMETEGAYCVWQNDYHKKSGICDFYINLFVEDSDGRYIRYEDVEREKYYSLTTLKRLLNRCGFEWIAVHGDILQKEVESEDDRWYITARAVRISKGDTI